MEHHSSGGYLTEAAVPAGARIVFVSTRRAQPAVDALASKVIAKYVLHDMLASVTAPMHELSSAQLVLLEVPPVATKGFERDLLSFVCKVLEVNVPVLAVVQPSLRKRSNYIEQAPFKFRQS